MADSSTSQPCWTQRVKVALIPALALVLVSVVWPSEDETAATMDMESGGPHVADSREAIPQQNGGVPTSELIRGQSRPWPAITLANVVQHDPFAVPPALLRLTTAPGAGFEDTQGAPPKHSKGTERADRLSQLQERIETLKKRQVSALLRGSKGATAIIDSKVVHEGDLLEDGVRVVEIGPNGVVLEIEAPENE